MDAAKRIGGAIARNIWPVAAWAAILVWTWTSVTEMDFTYMLGALLAMTLLAVDRVADHLVALRDMLRAGLEMEVAWQKYEMGRHQSEATRRIVVKGLRSFDPDAVVAAFQEAIDRKMPPTTGKPPEDPRGT